MTSERQACGLGSFLPMSCRGRAEAFARRLQSRLQSLGRDVSGDGPSTHSEEGNWLEKQPTVTSHQPRLSSSSESDIYFDFDLDCESPGSPVDETACSETLPVYLVNKSRAFHTPPKSQFSSESGCVVSYSTTGTSPGSDSSDGPYFDSENIDPEVTNLCQNHNIHSINLEDIGCYESSPDGDTKRSITQGDTDDFDVPYGRLNGHISKSSPSTEEGKRNVRRNFRNAAGFRISSVEAKKEADISAGKLSNDDQSDTTDGGVDVNSKSLSHEHHTTVGYFECFSLKNEEAICEDLNSLCMHDSGFTNTAESSRCSSQIENSSLQLETTESIDDTSLKDNSNSTQNVLIEQETDTLPSSGYNEPQSDVSPEDYSSSSTVSLENCDQLSDKKPLSSLTDTSQTSSLSRPSDLKIECSELTLSIDTTTETWASSGDVKKPEYDEDDDKVVPRVRRCSSLKTGKTPPGTPGRKKIVRFADVLGLDLADIRTFLDEIPKVPRSAYEDLECSDIPDASTLSITESAVSCVLPSCINLKTERCLIPLFQQPAGQSDFMDRIKEEQVCLENAMVTDTVSFTISGTVRVRNLDFHKSVHIRYTLDGWNTFADLQATYVPNSCDGFSDKFSFMLYAHTVQVGQRLEFAVRFQCKGVQYWDSNHGVNYVFQCLPPTENSENYAPISISPDEHFSTSFY